MNSLDSAIRHINAIQEKLDEMQTLLTQEKADVDKAGWGTVSNLAAIHEQTGQILAFWNNEQE